MRKLLLALVAILFVVPAAAVAQVDVYSVSGGFTAPATGTWSGTYDYNTATNTVVSVNIQTTPGLATDGATALPASTFIFAGFNNATTSSFSTAVPATGLRGGILTMNPNLGAPAAVQVFIDGICLVNDCSGVQTLPSASRQAAAGAVALVGTLPAITSLAPATGLPAGGTPVVITGTNFTGATAVTFGGVPGTGLVVNSATQITVTTPAHAVGTVDVQVTTPVGTSLNSVADDFVYAVPASVPTLSEWAMILFGLLLAGSAALYIQRRQPAV